MRYENYHHWSWYDWQDHITLYFFLFISAIFLLSFDPVNGEIVTIVSDAGTYTVEHGFFSNFSAVLTCISNVGPAFEAVGPYSSFAGYSGFSKNNLNLDYDAR